jgi:cellulose synthase/poly-beta-1,6-N-acetylglucosamine synthase-like glycosyltransferase
MGSRATSVAATRRLASLRAGLGLAAFCAVVFGPVLIAPGFWLGFWRQALAIGFVAAAVWRVTVVLSARRPPPAPALADEHLPPYTVVAPMYGEAGMVDQLVRSLDALDYPRDRLQIILALEADDEATQAAVQAHILPPHFEVLVAPPGYPQTKPRACNIALEQAWGELLTIYDAEDRPDPQQLREAAARFAAGPTHLGCLQAPLRISNSRGFLPAQFANEYAAQFELLLPAMARLGLPFPLGGTSNHLRTAALKDVGGWDPFNVTEDADLGFRLAAAGWSLGVLDTPTWEDAPVRVYHWLPQRSRWLKGYLQTLLRQLPRTRGDWRLAFAMLATVGLAVVSALVHLPAFMWLMTYALFWLLGGPGPSMTRSTSSPCWVGWTAAVAAGRDRRQAGRLAVRCGTPCSRRCTGRC